MLHNSLISLCKLCNPSAASLSVKPKQFVVLGCFGLAVVFLLVATNGLNVEEGILPDHATANIGELNVAQYDLDLPSPMI